MADTGVRTPPSSTGVLNFYNETVGGPKIGPAVILFAAIVIIIVEVLFRVF